MIDQMRIRYNKTTWLASSFLAKFFEMCGFMVYEEKIEELDDKLEEIEDDVEEIIIEAENENLNKKFLKETIIKNLSEMVNVNDFEQVINAYVDFEMHKNILNLEYSGKYDNMPMSNIYKALKYLERYITLNNPYLQYAILYCKYKVNKGYKMMKYGYEFKIEDLNKECETYASIYNSNAISALLGRIQELEPKYAQLSISSYSRILNIVSYSNKAFIFYHLAKVYENYEANIKDSLEDFRKSIKFSANVISLYDFANKLIDVESKKDYELELERIRDEKLECLNQILEILEKKEKEMPLNPKELRIRIATNVYLMAEYFLNKKDCLKTIQFESSLKSYYSQIDKAEFFDIFYTKEEADKYRKITKKYLQMAMKRGYTILYYSYHYLGLNDMAAKCIDKLNEFS